MDYDPRTALVIVDVQNDFAIPPGGLSVRGGDESHRRLNDELEARPRRGRARRAHAGLAPAVHPALREGRGIWPVHCVRGTWGAEFHRDLDGDR